MITSSFLIDALVFFTLLSACYISFYFYRLGNIKFALLGILFLGALLRIYVGMDEYLHIWDERYHALVAKNMMKDILRPVLFENPVIPYDYRAWCCNHIWLNKPPLPFWLMSGSMSIFGSTFFALRLPSFILSMLGIYLTFKIGSVVFSPKTGLISAFLYAVNGKIIEIAAGCDSSDHVETCHIVFFELAILLLIKYWNKRNIWLTVFIGVSIGLTFLSKWTPAIFIFFIYFVGGLWQKIDLKQIVKDGLIIAGIAFFVAAPWVWYIFNAFPKESENIYKIITTANKVVIEGHSGEWYFYLNKIRIIFGEIIYLPMLAGIVFLARRLQFSKISIIFLWMVIPLIFFSISATKRDTYLMILAPSFFLLIALYVRYLLIHIKNWGGYILVALLLILPLRYGVERSKIFKERLRVPEWMHEIRNIKESLLVNSEKVVILGFEHNLELMFHTGVIAYPHSLDSTKIQELKNKGFMVFSYNNKRLIKY